MNRRNLFKLLGATAAVTAAGTIVPAKGVTPRAGDIVTFAGNPQRFIVISVNGANRYLPIWS